MKEEQKYYGKVTKFEEAEKSVECVILHFDVANENYWIPGTGCLDAFLERLRKAKKNVPVCYQHNTDNLIGQMTEWNISNGELSGKLVLDDIPFVRDVVIPQLKSGTLQGTSPTIAPISEYWDENTKSWAIKEGSLCEVSLVGLPADLKADILKMSAMVSLQDREKQNFELQLLTL